MVLFTRNSGIIYMWLRRNINSQKSERDWHHKMGDRRRQDFK